jgi:putative tryptophan/tyrosine transport system substrate-binding protein
VKRRAFISLLGGAATLPILQPLTARAQQGEHPRRVGVLTTLAENDLEDRAWLGAFRQRLQELGWVEGRNVQFAYRRTMGRPDLAETFASEIVASRPDMILIFGGTATSALLKQTRTVPAIFVMDTDPVQAGFVASLARPGGNATGFTSFERTLGPKWLELLKQIAPGIDRVVILHSDNPQATVVLPTIEAALPLFKLQVTDAIVHDAKEIERAIDETAGHAHVGLLVLASTVAFLNRDLITARAASLRLPAVYTNSVFIRSGGLLSYGVDRLEQFRQAAGYADRILRGEKPADLPVQTPIKFELIINLKTAKTLGLDIPSTLLALADEVIE